MSNVTRPPDGARPPRPLDEPSGASRLALVAAAWRASGRQGALARAHGAFGWPVAAEAELMIHEDDLLVAILLRRVRMAEIRSRKAPGSLLLTPK
jgi:hypothetical protein